MAGPRMLEGQPVSTPTPAYAYGRMLGELQRAYLRMFQQIAAGMRDVRLNRPLTPEQREILREQAYRNRIERERTMGRLYVDRIVREARRDLGLTGKSDRG